MSWHPTKSRIRTNAVDQDSYLVILLGKLTETHEFQKVDSLR